ncbi:MAG TPA: hypothetical protein VM866_08060 [Pyrinomonadaceae bacterium]|nr:hypothetical protein [Pyrinomonadaceae bacterium]
MKRYKIRSLKISLAVFGCLLILQGEALAGPPLLCKPFDIGDARSLAWGGPQWRDVKSDYDPNRLVDETLALLNVETPVIVRMETLRRAAIYSAWSLVDREVGYTPKNTKIAGDLLSRLLARSRDARLNGRAKALALFDAGYLAETVKQASAHSSGATLARDVDGYAMIVRAISLSGRDPEMEFAAAMTTIEQRRGLHREHLQKAFAGASNNSLLARNLANQFGDKEKAVAELR